MADFDAKSADLSALRINREHKSSPPGRRKRLLYLLWLLVPVLVFIAYRVAIQKAAPAVSVQIGTAQFLTGSDAQADLVATGYVVAQRKAAVSSKATGRLEVLNVEEGDRVAAGQIIAQLENSDIKAALDLAVANLKKAQADSLEAALNFKRQTELLKSGASTQDVVEVATARYDAAIASVQAMRANVKAAEVALENTLIRAPFNGTVLTKEADVGEMVAPFASSSSSRGAVVTMADMRSLEVEADVSESNIQRVKPDQPCEIILDAYPEFRYRGFVKKIVPTADRSRATVLTKVAFKNLDSRVLPEMSARVNFLPVEKQETKESQGPVLTVPKNAVTTRGNNQVVFKIVEEYAQETPVTIGRELGTVREIKSGLSAGDRVVLSPPGKLKSGDKVKLSN
jgi:RND family efflux transporter MFP subunit